MYPVIQILFIMFLFAIIWLLEDIKNILIPKLEALNIRCKYEAFKNEIKGID